MDTTITLPMRVRPTVITGLTGLQADYSLAPVPGITDIGAAAAGDMDAATTAEPATVVMGAVMRAVAATTVDTAPVMPDMVTLDRVTLAAARSAADIAAALAVASTEAVAHRTVEAAFTAEAVDAGNIVIPR